MPQQAMKTVELAIVGAGVIGLSIAWQLSRRGYRDIVVLEKGRGPAEGSSGASSAICRYRYSLTEMIRLARTGIETYRHWPDFIQLPEPRARFHNDGVLWFTGNDALWADREQARLQSLGIRCDVLDAPGLRDAFPAINPCTAPIDMQNPDEHLCQGEGRHLLELDGGYMDPVDTVQDLIEACRGAGIETRFDTRVSSVETAGGRVSGVTLSSGEHLGCGAVVNAAGPWCQSLYQALGMDPPMPLMPVRIQVVYLNRSPALAGKIPVCADLHGGIYFRTQNRGQQLLVGSVREEDERETVKDPDCFSTLADEDFKREKLHLLQHRLPGLQLDASIRDYCGLYTVNLADVHPLLGACGPTGYYVANGFSGHGFKIAPAVGALMARKISGVTLPGEDPCDDDWLSPSRSPIDLVSKSVLA